MVTRHRTVNRIIFFCLVTLTLITTIFPFLVMLSTALKTNEEALQVVPQLIPKRITWENFQDVLNPEKFPFWIYFRNSFEVSFITAFFSVVIGTMGAYSFARLNYKGRNLFQKGVMLIYMFSGVLLVVPLYQMITAINLYDSKLSLIITYLVLTMPVSLYMLGNYFRTIPESLEEASMIDGLSRFQVIYKIVIPLSLPAIVSVFIYVFMIAWNEYLFASVFITSEENMTLPIGLSHLFNTKHYVWGRMMAASLLTAVPIVILYALVDKYLTGGLTEGGVKE
ncbi:putative sugar transporter subunit: permease component of ABC superfamily transporter [[Clostridium] ultunense Esp]|uniref:carbohydrate ABC transporter permease n=1 Tax=Thermicanus aegyptius TaxID=94009 RepID=UPI0002B70690|nr:carbohydrate ABC transporter permease [Thermicanus aegyptius]CCQ96494.1 putative sugar transporter subunit: permease component of ABC superfamily transporter [[Clostridium] ultunense Esp]